MSYDPAQWGGWDTETDKGVAVLVCTDRASLVFPKTFKDIAEFLLSDGRTNLSAYNLSYDARAILWKIPRKKLATLHRLTRVRVGRYFIRYIPRKLLQIGDGDRTVRLWDIYSFFGGKLETTAQKILGEGKEGIPRSWLPRMGRLLHRPKPRAVIVRYCQRDAELARRLANYLYERAYNLGAWSRSPYSPASLARMYFKKDFPPEPPVWAQELFRKSYYGGRIEIFKRGRMTRTYHYDINSAYPAAFCGMPSPGQGEYVRVEKGHEPSLEAIYGSYRVRATVDPAYPIPALPLRFHDLLIYPAGQFETWIDLQTWHYVQAFLSDSHRVEILEGVEIIDPDPGPIFLDAAKLYRERQQNPDMKLVYKLVLNSLYGVTASVVDRWIETKEVDPEENEAYIDGKHYVFSPVYTKQTNFAIAARITAATRIRLHQAMMTRPSSIAAVATDGIVSTRPLPLKESTRLGEWGPVEKCLHESVVMSGMRCFWKDGKYREVTRGMHSDKTLYELLRSKQAERSPKVRYSALTVDGIGQTLRSRAPELFNVIRRIPKFIDVNADVKRVWPRPWKRAREVLEQCQTSESRIIL